MKRETMNREILETPSGWERLFGALVVNKVLILVPALLLLFGGLAVLPFDGPSGPLPRDPVPVDAIPDTGENQQIVFTRWPGRSPRDIDDQVTYPLTTLLLSVPGVRTVRSQSMFGFSSIYVLFEEGVEFYWSRERLLERISSLPPGTLPDGVSPRLGPEATALGQIFWYTLEGRNESGELLGGWDRDELRSVQDWTIRYALQSVPGVAEVASVGGFVREYQVDVDPDALAAHQVTIAQVARAITRSNQEIGARTLEINRAEYVVRSRGFVSGTADLEQAVVAVRDNTPIRVRDVARVMLGPANRRGALDDAGAEAVGGVVVARYGENPMAVIDAVKQRIAEIAPTLPARVLPDGQISRVTIAPFYDRSELIDETLDTLGTALYQQILITILVVLVLLRHLRSSLLITGLVPLAVLLTFLAMKLTGVDANVMSLAGIAIAIGTMVDISIVLVENIVRSLDDAPPDEDRVHVIRRAAAEVAPAILTSVATTVVSFVPVFALTAAEGKLFRPLAFTKTYALIASVLIAIALLPALAHLVLYRRARRSRRSAQADPSDPTASPGSTGVKASLRSWIQRFSGPAHIIEIALGAGLIALYLTDHWRPLGLERSLASNLVFVVLAIVVVLGSFSLFQRYYRPMLRWCLGHKALFLVLPTAILLFGSTVWLGFDRTFGRILDALPGDLKGTTTATDLAAAAPGFGREFMPPLDEGSFLVMPVTMPHASFGQSLELLQQMDAALAAIPEVDRVVGKLGRVDSALDPAPVSMFETVVTYKPEYSFDDAGNRVRNWRDHIRTPQDIWDALAEAAALPGLTPVSRLMPIETRRIMLQTGMRGTIGLRIRGPDLTSLEQAALTLEQALREVRSIASATVNAERVVGKPYLEIDLDREAISRYGLDIADVQELIAVALGGRPLTRTVEGRARYPVRVRYMREKRDSLESLSRVLVATPAGQQIPLGQLAGFEYVRGPQVIKAEDTFKTAYVTFGAEKGFSSVDVVEDAAALLDERRSDGRLQLPAGVTYEFAGDYENQVRSERRLTVLVPVALAIVFFLLYLQFRRTSTALIIYTGVAIAVAGGFVLIWLYGRSGFLDVEFLGANLRDLFQVGTIKLSVAVWVGVIALIGIATDNGVVLATYLQQQMQRGPVGSLDELRDRIVIAGDRRVRACLMTTATTILALLPVVTSQGRGADVMVPMAIPVLGGVWVALLSLFVVPVLYSWVEELGWRRGRRSPARLASADPGRAG